MQYEVTDKGVMIPKEWLNGAERVIIRREADRVIIIPVSAHDPIFDLDKDPVDDDITDASTNLDRYLYG